MAREERKRKRPPRSQAGYVPPKRADTVILKTNVKRGLRQDFHKVAEILGVPSEVLLSYLAKSTIQKASSDPEFMKKLRDAIANDSQRSNVVRENVLASVSDAILKSTLG